MLICKLERLAHTSEGVQIRGSTCEGLRHVHPECALLLLASLLNLLCSRQQCVGMLCLEMSVAWTRDNEARGP